MLINNFQKKITIHINIHNALIQFEMDRHLMSKACQNSFTPNGQQSN